MLRDAKGNRLFRKIEIRILFPDKVLPAKLLTTRAGAHMGFNPEGVDEVLNGVVDQLDTLYPWWNFRSVELKPEGRTARFVFDFVGYRSVKPSDAVVPELSEIPTLDERSALKLDTVASITPPEAKPEGGLILAAPPFQE